MKKRPHNKKAGIIVLTIILILSLADVILRATLFKEISSTISNYGESLITVAFSTLLLIFALKGKERVFYVLCGVWIAYFVMNQLYGLPSMISDLTRYIATENVFGTIAAIAHIISIILIIAIGALIVEYMNDGTIYNKAFNILCATTVILLGFLYLHNLNDIYSYARNFALLALLHELSRLAMVFLFTFFAYDIAKYQLKKTNFTE